MTKTIDLGIKFKGKYEIFKDYNGKPGKKIAETKNDIQYGFLDYLNTRFMYEPASGYRNTDGTYYRGIMYNPRLFLGNDDTPQTRFDADDDTNGVPKQITTVYDNADSALGVVKGYVQGNIGKNSNYGVEADGNKRRCLFTCNITQDFTLKEVGVVAQLYRCDASPYERYMGVSRAVLDTPIDVVNGDTIHIIYTIEFDTSTSTDGWYLVGGGKWLDYMIGDGSMGRYYDDRLLNYMGISTDSTHLDPLNQPYDTTDYLTASTNFVDYEVVETSGGRNIRASIWECTIPNVPANTYGNITFFWEGESILRKEQTLQVDTDNSNVYFKIRVYFG